MDINSLLQRCQDGDELAWEALVRLHQARVFGIAFHYVGNLEDARDLAQEIFIRVYRNIRMCPRGDLFVPWLVRVTRNACLDHLRRSRVRPPASDIPLNEAKHLTAPGKNPEEEWATNRRKRIIHRALQTLTALNREIILLKEIQGLRLDEIASLLKVPLGTIKSRCNRARLELAEKVLAMAGDPDGRSAG